MLCQWGDVLLVAHTLANVRGLLAHNDEVPSVLLRGRHCWLAPETLLMQPGWYCKKRYAVKNSMEGMARKSFEANLSDLQLVLPGNFP